MTSPPPLRSSGYRPQLAPRVLVSDALLRDDRTVHLVKDTARGRAFEVGPKEHFLITRMDGEHSLADLGSAYARTYGRRLGEENWRQLLGLLGSRGLLAGAPPPDEGTDGPAGEAPRRANSVLAGSIPLVSDAQATADRLHRAAGGLLRARWLVPLLALVVAMETVAVLRLDELVDGAWRIFQQPVLLLGVATLLWFSTALHELAHGVVARHHGGQVSEIGLRWRLPVVLMYCTVDNFPYLPARRQRIATAAAGAVMNLLFLLPFAAVWLWVPVDAATEEGLAGLLFLGSLQALAMLVPLPPLDGYQLLSQALGANDLAGSSRRYLSLRLRRSPDAARYPRRARRLYTGYGLGAVLLVGALATAVLLLVHHLVTTP